MTTEPDDPSTPSEPERFFVMPTPVVARRRSRGTKVGALIGVVGMVGGGVFALRSMAAPPGNTPSQAVEQMTKAVAAGDVIGAMEALAPGERDVMIEAGVPLLEQLKRLDVLKSDLDLKNVTGAGISFAGQTYTEAPARADIVNVNVKGGTYKLSADMANLPIGGWLRGLMADEIDGRGKVSEEKPVAGDGATLTTIKDDGRWYVSFLYSIAEAGREESGKAMPATGSAVAARGEDTPEGAVRSMLTAAAALDVRRMIELLPSDEMGVLHDYAPMFLSDAESAARSAASNYSLTFPNLGLTVEGSGDSAKVRISRWSADLRLKSVDGTEATLLLDGDCVAAKVGSEEGRRCGKEIWRLPSDLGMTDDDGESPTAVQMRDRLGTVLDSPSALGAMTVVRRDGRWYVSPSRTVLDSITSRLAKVKTADIKQFQDSITKAMEDGMGLFG